MWDAIKGAAGSAKDFFSPPKATGLGGIAKGISGGISSGIGMIADHLAPEMPFDLVGPGGLLPEEDYQPGYLAPGLPGGLMMPEEDYQPGYLAPGLPGGLYMDGMPTGPAHPEAITAAYGHFAD